VRLLIISVLAVAMIGLMVPSVHAEQVPSWVKSTAGWWATDNIEESEFVSAIQYLIQNKIIQISETEYSTYGKSVKIQEVDSYGYASGEPKTKWELPTRANMLELGISGSVYWDQQTINRLRVDVISPSGVKTGIVDEQIGTGFFFNTFPITSQSETGKYKIHVKFGEREFEIGSFLIVGKNNNVPDWIKNTAKWWADGTISDQNFLDGIKFLIENGIIVVNMPETESAIDEFNEEFSKNIVKTSLHDFFPTTKKLDELTSFTDSSLGPNSPDTIGFGKDGFEDKVGLLLSRSMAYNLAYGAFLELRASVFDKPSNTVSVVMDDYWSQDHQTYVSFPIGVSEWYEYVGVTDDLSCSYFDTSNTNQLMCKSGVYALEITHIHSGEIEFHKNEIILTEISKVMEYMLEQVPNRNEQFREISVIQLLQVSSPMGVESNDPPSVTSTEGFSGLSCRQDGDTVTMSGKYTNGPIPHGSIWFTMGLEDSIGTILTTGSGLISDIGAYQTKMFSVYTHWEYDFENCIIEVAYTTDP
jgi:hypothetical protein